MPRFDSGTEMSVTNTAKQKFVFMAKIRRYTYTVPALCRGMVEGTGVTILTVGPESAPLWHPTTWNWYIYCTCTLVHCENIGTCMCIAH